MKLVSVDGDRDFDIAHAVAARTHTHDQDIFISPHNSCAATQITHDITMTNTCPILQCALHVMKISRSNAEFNRLSKLGVVAGR